jgi:hypothetical protein
MTLFGRTGGYYLFWTGFVYFWVGMYLIFTGYEHPEFATLGFILALSVPLWCPPVARHFNMEPLMFDWFNKDKTPSNILQFPKTKETPYVEPPELEKRSPTIHYTIGHTDDNRVVFKMGYSTLTMNHVGVQHLIDQLELYKSQLYKEEVDEEETNDNSPNPA